MASLRVKFESEKKERELKHTIVKEHVTVKNKNVCVYDDSKTNEVVEKSMPGAYITHLPTFVTDLLDKYFETGQLVWNGIPTSEIWVKVGADHGQGSLKMALQVANTNSPNSKNNTVLCSLFKGKDDRENVQRIFSEYSTQIDELRNMTWNNKKIRVFMFGDYDFLTKMFGLSETKGLHPCLWCDTTNQNMQKPPYQQKEVEGRRLETLRRDYRPFMRSGRGNKQHAKRFNNVVSRPVWNIPLEHVCSPYLHILLGIVKKHHEMLESGCHDQDLKIVDLAQTSDQIDGNTKYGSFVATLRKKINLEKKIQKKEHRQHGMHGYTDQEKTKLETLKRKLKKLHTTQLPYRSGPGTSNLENILQRNKICPQAYHGRSFIGNHCGKYLSTTVIESLTHSILIMTNSLTKKIHLC